MSTRIHRGVRFRPKDFIKLHARIMQWRVEATTLAVDRMAMLLARNASDVFDRRILGISLSDDAGRSPISTAWRDILDRQRDVRTTRERDPEIDFAFEIWLLVRGRSFYGIVSTEQNAWRDAFVAQSWVEEYGYWDGDDRPSGMPVEEWELRGRTWDAIFSDKNGSTPSSQCYTVEVVPEFLSPPENEHVERHLETPDVRARRWAIDALLQKHAPDAAGSVSEAFRIHSRFRKWLETEEGVKALETERSTIAERLPALKYEDLAGSQAE